MLTETRIVPYVPASNLERARKFYEEKLGFKPRATLPAGVLYDAGKGTSFFLYKSQGAGTNKSSTAYWEVPNLDAEMTQLRSKGITFEEYDMPGVKTQNGVANCDGIKTAWFKDSEGNVLAVAQRA